MMARLQSLGLVLVLGSVIATLAVAQDTTAPAIQTATSPASETTGTNIAAIPVVTGTCALAPTSGEFAATQAEDRGKIFSVKFGNCRFERTTDGLNALSVEVRLQFEPTAILSHCSAISVAFLFEVAPTTPGFNWPGSREVVVDLPLRNLSGNDQNISMFRLHSGNSPSTYTVEQVLSARPDVPNFDHIYWGNFLLLKEPRTSEFAAEMARNTPIVGQGGGKVDYTMGLSVKVAQPRGWCWFLETDAAGSPINKRANLAFAETP